MRRAGDAGVLHFVETLHGLVAVVLSALERVMHGHGAAVVVDVVAALAVGEDLGRAGRSRRGWGQRVGAVRVPDAEGDLDRLGVDEGRAAGQRDVADPRGCGGERAQKVLRVVPRRDVAGVACFQLVFQALHQLILGSGSDYLHASLYARILSCTAKKTILLVLHLGRHWKKGILKPKTAQKSYYSGPYMTRVIAFLWRKTVQKAISLVPTFRYAPD